MGGNYWIESGISNLQKVLDSLSSYLTEEYGRGFSRSNVAGMRQFYMAYKDREDEIIQSGIGQLL